MCKTRFDSHGMILNGVLKNNCSKYVNGTRDPPSWQMPFYELLKIDLDKKTIRQKRQTDKKTK